jgi:WD40 repeat protein/DNA-binding SARP family transcriptional activator
MRARVLGPLEVTDGAHRPNLGGPKQRLVLAHLLMRANSVVSTDVLIQEVWGDDPPPAARSSLQSYVSHLRGALGNERLVSRPPGYVLQIEPEAVDASRFASLVARGRRQLQADPSTASRILRDALRLWNGEPYADLSNEPSLHAEIERLCRLRLDAIEDSVEADLMLGRHLEVISELETVLPQAHVRERLWGQLMLALYRAGRQAEALDAYHRLRATLSSDLGVEPSPLIQQLQQRILRHDPSLELRGEALRGYRILEQIGAGRTGTVHRAIEPQTGREVAIRRLGARVANQTDFIRRFEAAAARVARLEHPNIVPLYDWWREPDSAYIVMRLLPGTLSERLRSPTLNLADALRTIDQVGSALAAAHRASIVHGDLRPANVLLDDQGNAYLADFATGFDPLLVARRADQDAEYVAPERRDGVQPSSDGDVYALGALLGNLLDASGADRSDPRAQAARAVVAHATAPAAERCASALDVVEELHDAIGLSSRVARAPRAVDVPVRNPYKGLLPFDEADAPYFYGRASFVDRLLARLAKGGRFVAVVGPSGSGKSSVVNAGLLPSLRSGAVAGSDRWLIAVMTPGSDPFDQLSHAIGSVAVDADRDLHELSVVGQDRLTTAIARALPPESELLLVIDRFEELYSMTDEPMRTRFLGALARMLGDPASRIRVVMTLRADFYDRPLRHRGFSSLLADGTEVVTPLSPDELELAVVGPAERAGLQIGRGLVSRIVAETSDRSGALPLLQFVLAELFERRAGTELTVDAYERSGGVGGAVSRRAERLYLELDAPGQEAVRQLFLRLVEPGEGTPDTTRRIHQGELERRTDSPLLTAVLERFARYRLLLLDRDAESRAPTVEVAHEALLHAWPRLQAWVDESREEIRIERRLAAAAAQWAESGREPSYLLAGSRLSQTAGWAETASLELTPVERDLVQASLAERDRADAREEERRAREVAVQRQAVRRLRGLVAALGLGGLVAASLSLYALGESQRAGFEARVAAAREVAAASIASLGVDTELSVLLAIEAASLTLTSDGVVLREAEEALHRSVASSRLVSAGPGGPILAWSPDGSRILNADPAGAPTATVYDAATGSVMFTTAGRHEEAIRGVAWSPDGRFIVTVGAPAVQVWDGSTGELVRSLETAGEDCLCSAATFSADGRLLATMGGADATLIWETKTWSPASEPILGTGGPASWSPRGNLLATTAGNQVAISSTVAGAETIRLRGHTGPIDDLAWATNGLIATSSVADRTVRIWDAADGALRWTIFVDAHGVDWDETGNSLATAGADGVARVWEIGSLGPREVLALAGHRGGVQSVEFSPDGSRLASGGFDDIVRIWDLRPTAGGELWKLPAVPRRLANMGLDPDGELLAIPVGNAGVDLYDARTGEWLGGLGTGLGGVVAAGIDADGRVLVTGTDRGAVRVWDLATQASLLEIGGHGAPVNDIVFDPAGRWLATGSDDAVVISDLATGEQLWSTEGARDLAVSNVGLLAATAPGEDGSVVIWDTATRQQIATIRHPGWANVVKFNGEFLLTAGRDGAIRVWDLTGPADPTSLTPIATWVTTQSQVWDLELAPDGATVASSSHDGTIRLWDLATTRELLTIQAASAPVYDVAFGADGTTLLSYDATGIVQLWSMDVQQLLEIAQQRVTRSLSDVECRQFLGLDRCP